MGDDAELTVTIAGWPTTIAGLRHYRMDADHSNAFKVWQGMGSPQAVDSDMLRRLNAASQLALLEEAAFVDVDGSLTLSMRLPRQGVSLLRLDF